MSDVRQRSKKVAKTGSGSQAATSEKRATSHSLKKEAPAPVATDFLRKPCAFRYANIALTVISFVTRFYAIDKPSEVVFDEVHFGKFASYYLERTYFFDLHPPFAKLLFALVGYLVGYSGSFKFNDIGDDYIKNNVPYVAYRALPATMGSLTVPIVFLTLQECGFSLPSCVIGAVFVLFDNAHIAEERLILLDACLILSVALSLYSYVRFSKLRTVPFSNKWWKWLLLTGTSLSCVISTKYVGAFTFAGVGSAVLVDLWNLLDIKAGLTMRVWWKHFTARFVGLVCYPFVLFLFWFWVHFEILSRSGPGDSFMSPYFQESLGENPLAKEAVGLNYFDIVTLKNKDTGAFLHSHEEFYPLRYDDGRISSEGQQVTGYAHADENNEWQVLAAFDIGTRKDVPVVSGQLVRLKHVGTDTLLRTHDVASPYYPTNEEFTVCSIQDTLDLGNSCFNDTLFELRVNNAKGRERIKTKMSLLKVIHVPTKVAMWTDEKALPDWGFGQQEINGNKHHGERGTTWFFDEIIDLDDPLRLAELNEVKHRKHIPFLTKYLELQRTMFRQNNALVVDHPYASEPITWPFLVRGVSFWTQDSTRKQIYFIGNIAGWWLEFALITVYFAVLAADQLTRRRNFYPISERARNKLYNSTGFFVLNWALHYFPFFLMNRQKFLHHYLPANLCSALAAGSLFDFLFGELDEENERKDTNYLLGVATASVGVVVFVCFLYYAPLTYGNVGLSIEAVKSRQLMGIELHFAK